MQNQLDGEERTEILLTALRIDNQNYEKAHWEGLALLYRVLFLNLYLEELEFIACPELLLRDGCKTQRKFPGIQRNCTYTVLIWFWDS